MNTNNSLSCKFIGFRLSARYRFLAFMLCLFLLPSGTVWAQSECLPQTFGIQAGGALSLPCVDGNHNDFFNKNGNRPGYDLLLEGRYYFTPYFAVGAQYDYLRAARLPDKMHVHFVRPALTFRYLWSNGNQGAFFSLGVGYMNYQERTYQAGHRNATFFQQDYCGLSFGIGWEFRITQQFSGVLRADILTADWFVNPDARLWNPNPDSYDDGIDHSFFKSRITFINIGFAIQFGK